MSLLHNIPFKPVISGYLALSQSLLQTYWVKVKIHYGRNSRKISMLTVIQIQLLSRSTTSSFKNLVLFCLPDLDHHNKEDQRELPPKLKWFYFHRNGMKHDARRSRQCNRTFIFRNMIVDPTEIWAQSFSKLLGSDRVAAILKVYCDKNFLH